MNIKKFLLKQSTTYPNKPAIIHEEKEISFLELKDSSFKLANYLLNSGIKQSEKIAVFLPTIPEAIISYFGVFSMGATLVPLDFMLTEEEAVFLINHSEARVLITQPKQHFDLNKIKQSCAGLEKIIICSQKIDSFTFYDDIIEQSSIDEPCVDIKNDSLSSIFYTSGSTGNPKGVMLTYKHFNVPLKVLNYLPISFSDITLCVGLPLSHMGGFIYILLMLNLAQTLILMTRFIPMEALKNIEKHKVTFFWMVPSMYVAILSLKEYDKFDLSSLNLVCVFGAPSSPVLLKKFHKICPKAHLFNGWGMTETVGPSCFAQPGIKEVRSIGKFMSEIEAKVIDGEGNTLGPETPGELLIRGEVVMAGYYKEDKLTKEIITPDGWLKTGDIAKVDKNGLFYIVGRIRDVIKVAGELVFSTELEQKIHQHPKVKEVAVVGVADKLRGEVPKAFIVVKENEQLAIEDLRQFLKQNLAGFKMPHYFDFLQDLPKTRSGKIDKTRLAKEIKSDV